MTFRQHLMIALRTSQNPLDFIFHIGYQQMVLPRWFRRAFARSRIHKAWLEGFHGWWIGNVVERSAWDAEVSCGDSLTASDHEGGAHA